MKRNKPEERRQEDRRQNNRRKTDKKIRWTFIPKFLIISALIGGVVFLWMRQSSQEEEITKQIKIPVRVVYPERGSIRRSFKISGYIESESMVTVLPKISGTLTDLWVDVGDRVYKNFAIGTIDSAPYELTMRQAEAAYLAAKATHDRMEQLWEARATSKQNYDQAKSQYEATKSQYELTVLNHDYTRVTAPINGVVLQKHSSRGSLVAPQVPIVTIGDLENLVVTARIPEKYYIFFTVHQNELEIEAELPALDNGILRASIKTVSPYISPETKTFEIVCTLTGATAFLRPGMFVYLTFILDMREDVLYLPFDTLIAGDTIWYIERETCKAQKILYIPPFFNNEFFEISEEYEGYPFIIEGQNFIRENQECRVLNDSSLCVQD